MDNSTKDANLENSSAPNLESALAASETAEEQQSQGTETATPQKAESQEQEEQQETEEVPFHKHPRFQELVEERNWYKKQVEQALQSRQPQNLQQPTQDPYANMTPEEERFWRAVDARAEKIAEQKIQKVTPVIDAGRAELAQMKVAQFRASHPDVKPNSPDEFAIAQRIQMGYPPEDAYWSVMGSKGIHKAEQKVKQEVKQKIAEKKQANVETTSSSVSPQASQKGDSFKDTFLKNLRLVEEGKI